MSRLSLFQVYKKLLDVHGPQDWWPGETDFEIMVGAVLTQNTSWTNVEKAITNLRMEAVLDAGKISAMSHKKLAALLVPVGYFNLKATRLKNFCDWYRNIYEVQELHRLQTDDLRKELLGINGVGPETADDILLYAFSRPIFVIDMYTRRLFKRLGFIEGEPVYDELRLWFEKKLARHENKVQIFNEYHALIVHHAKYFCSAKPKCNDCCLNRSCLKRY